MQAKLAFVPGEAARVSGPRGDNDVSYCIWERKKKAGEDYEAPIPVSQWKQTPDFRREFMPLMNCTDTE